MRTMILLLALLICLPAHSTTITGGGFTGSSVDTLATSLDPYDLTAYETEMALAFDGNGTGDRPAWPAVPDASTLCAATDSTSLATCITAGANQHITVAAGTYTNSFVLNDDDVWLDMVDGAIIQGLTAITSASRIKVTGGTIEGGKFNLSSLADVLIENVNLDLQNAADSGMFICEASSCNRVAFVDTTCHAQSYCGLGRAGTDGDISDIIFANVDAWTEGSDSARPHFRLQNYERLLVVDSNFRVGPTSTQTTMRFHFGAREFLILNNKFSNIGTFTSLWFDTRTGISPEESDMENIYIIGNDLYRTGASGTDVSLDDSVAGGPGYKYFYIHDNTAYWPTSGTFNVVGSGNPTNCNPPHAGACYDAGGNTRVGGTVTFPDFTGGSGRGISAP